MSTTEPRHEENVDNLGILIHNLQTFGISYQPSNAAFSIASLTLLKTQGSTAVDAVSAALLLNKNAISSRTYLFTPFDAKQQSVDQALTLIREIRGKRASHILTDAELSAEKEKGNIINQIIKHNAAMKIQTTNFGILTKLLIAMPEYKPNELDLKTTALVAKQAEMAQINDTVDHTTAELNAKRIARQNILYAETTGLVSVAMATKLYVKAAYGANSPQYKQISKIKFHKHK
jgi:hypothetical protein